MSYGYVHRYYMDVPFINTVLLYGLTLTWDLHLSLKHTHKPGQKKKSHTKDTDGNAVGGRLIPARATGLYPLSSKEGNLAEKIEL